MSIYNSHVIHWPLNVGDSVGYIRNPFIEYVIDPIFRVIAVYDDFTVDIECVDSTFLSLGTTYRKQPIRGLRKLKRTPINEALRYNNRV